MQGQPLGASGRGRARITVPFGPQRAVTGRSALVLPSQGVRCVAVTLLIGDICLPFSRLRASGLAAAPVGEVMLLVNSSVHGSEKQREGQVGAIVVALVWYKQANKPSY